MGWVRSVPEDRGRDGCAHTAHPRPMTAPGTARPTRSLDRWVAGAVALVLIVTVAVLALRSDGFHATKVNLNDAGIWVVNWRSSLAGRINTQTGTIEVAVPSPTQSFDIAQIDDVVVLNV